LESCTIMDASTRIRMAPVSRSAWQELLARKVPAPEVEPAVRRRCRRYTVQLGAWCILYLKGLNPTELRVKLLNASLDGVMVLSREEVPENVQVVMAFNGDEEIEYVLAGEGVHCTSTVGGYKVGIRLRFPIADETPS
jgi:hypothetical protein